MQKMSYYPYGYYRDYNDRGYGPYDEDAYGYGPGWYPDHRGRELRPHYQDAYGQRSSHFYRNPHPQEYYYESSDRYHGYHGPYHEYNDWQGPRYQPRGRVEGEFDEQNRFVRYDYAEPLHAPHTMQPSQYQPTGHRYEDPMHDNLRQYDRRSDAYQDRFRTGAYQQDKEARRAHERAQLEDPNTRLMSRHMVPSVWSPIPPAPKAISVVELLENWGHPSKKWLEVAPTEEKVFTGLGIPAAAQLCRFHMDSKYVSGCTNQGCPYSHSPYKFNCVQYALMLDDKVFDKLLVIHSKRQAARNKTKSLLSENALIINAEDLRARRHAANAAGVLDDERYKGIDWYAPAQPKPPRLAEGRDKAKSPTQGPSGKITERGQVNQSSSSKHHSKPSPSEENPSPKNGNPGRVLDLCVEGHAEKAIAYIDLCYDGYYSSIKEQKAARHEVRSLQYILLDINHPLWMEAHIAWIRIEEHWRKRDFRKTEISKTANVDFAMNEVWYFRQLVRILRKAGMEPD